MSDLRRLYAAWREAVATRSARGELRASTEERDALGRFTEALERCNAAERDAWDAERASIDVPESCTCGHPLIHHDESGSCFHVVGCATGCGCVR